MRHLPLLTLLSVLAAPAIARAAEPEAPGAHPVAPELQEVSGTSQPATPTAPLEAAPKNDAGPQTRQLWYGWQTVVVNAGTLMALLGVATATDWDGETDLMLHAAVGSYLVASPIVHVAHGKPLRGLGSLGLHAGAPLALGGLGLVMADGCRHGCVEPIVGGVLGVLTAVVVDATVWGYEDVPIEPEGVKNVGVSLGRDHAALVVGGRF